MAETNVWSSMRPFNLLFIATSLCAAAACGDSYSDQPVNLDASEDLAPVADSDEFIETSVRIADDGTTQVTERTITVGEERAEVAARRAAEQGAVAPAGADIAQDTGCANASLWLYDRASYIGNKLCFAGPGIAMLEDYSRWVCIAGTTHCFITNWELASGAGGVAGSYWAGSASGQLKTGPRVNEVYDASTEFTVSFGPYAHGDLVVTDGMSRSFTSVTLH